MGRTREPLTRERVAAAAVAIADAEGLGQVTMRRVATEVGVEAMSLYHHVANKEALLDSVAEALIGEVMAAVAAAEEAAPELDWARSLRRRFLTARGVMLRHPWAPQLIGSRTTAPMALYAYYDQVLATMVDGGVSYHLAHRAIHAFGSMALGFAQELFSPGDPDTAAPVDEEQLAQMAQAFPHLGAMIASELHAADEDVLGWCDSQAEFEFTLDLMLGGLERQAAGRA